MSKNPDSPKLYVAVDANKVARCEWCGGSESGFWVHRRDKLYCSTDCQDADTGNEQMLFGACLILIFLVISIPMLLGSIFMGSGQGFGISISLIFFCALFLVYWCSIYQNGKLVREKTPKGSRYNEAVSPLSLLKTKFQHIECPNCDGNINLSDVDEDMTYYCDYCGASGIVEILRSS
jgi:hypothetical protein